MQLFSLDSVVKAHPPHIYKNRTHKEKLKCAKSVRHVLCMVWTRWQKSNEVSLSIRGGVPDFKKVVLLLRDPYAAIWSEYQVEHIHKAELFI